MYVKAKGYGMGKYAGKLTSIITGKKQDVRLEGFEFEQTKENIANFKLWWKRINLEHLLVFWATGAATMLILSLLAYSTVFTVADKPEGIGFVLLEGNYLSSVISPLIGKLFFATVIVMLFFTQFSVFGSTSRIMSENLIIFSPQKFKIQNASKYFYFFLWLQIIAGIIIFSLDFAEPLALVILGAVLNAFSMFVYSGLIVWLNSSSLPKAIRPNLIRIGVVATAFLFYGSFTVFTILQNI